MTLDMSIPDLPIDRLPRELQDIIFDSHFSIGNKGIGHTIRITSDMERAIDVVLARLNSLGGIPWLATRTDLLRAGGFFFLALLKSCMENPPESLNVLIMSEIINGKANTRKILTERMRNAIELTAQQVFDLQSDSRATEEIKKLINELLNDIESINSTYWRNRWKRAVLDNMMLASVVKNLNLVVDFEMEE